MASLFLFGAGASTFGGPCSPEPPPLGQDLFAALQKVSKVAASITGNLALAFQASFEVGMDKFWLERNVDVAELLRDMAVFFAQFEPLDGNLYREVLSILKSMGRKAVLVTTNYDLLIERAVQLSGLKLAYATFPVPKDNVPVLKIHGSCNFLPDMRPHSIRGVKFDLSETSNSQVLDCTVRIGKNAQEVYEFCQVEDSIAPALAMYHPQKHAIFCKWFITKQQEAWHKALTKASRVFVIGLRVHQIDTHIWGALESGDVPLWYVGREPEEFLGWARESKRGNARVLAETFAEAIPKLAKRLS